MKPAETIRFACGDCQVVFDLCTSESEWAEANSFDQELDDRAVQA